MEAVVIKISPSELARQLPELRLAIIQTYEDDLVITGKKTEEVKDVSRFEFGSKEERFPILQHYPELFELFTRLELRVLSQMHNRPLTKADHEYAIWERNSNYGKNGSSPGNLIAVALYKIRRKLVEYNLPLKFELTGKAGNRYWALVKI